jgi:hypothetical protein
MFGSRINDESKKSMDIVRSTPTSQYDINVGITYLFNDRPP